MAALEEMTGHAEVLQLPQACRTVGRVAPAMGFSACKTYDLEVWVPAQNIVRSPPAPTSGISERVVYRRCRNKSDKKTRLVHTLNGSGDGRSYTLVALMENYQQADGRIEIPEVLRGCARPQYIG